MWMLGSWHYTAIFIIHLESYFFYARARETKIVCRVCVESAVDQCVSIVCPMRGNG